MSPDDLATLSFDPDQGVCPEGHPCRLGDVVGRRKCDGGDYVGPALICWDVTELAIDCAARDGARRGVVEWARQFLAERT